MTSWSGVKYLLDVHMQAAKWTAMKPDVIKKSEFVWRTAVQKNSENFLDAVKALHELRENGSDLSPPMWCWWRINQQLAEGYSGLAFASTWAPAALRSNKMRRWYYEEVNQAHISRRRVWPSEAAELLAIIQELEEKCSLTSDAERRAQLWAGHRDRYNKLLGSAQFNRDVATTRINDRVLKHDLGVWLATDPVSYLGLKQVSAQLAKTDLPSKPRLRKKAS